jgi:hypothetical protein
LFYKKWAVVAKIATAQMKGKRKIKREMDEKSNMQKVHIANIFLTWSEYE